MQCMRGEQKPHLMLMVEAQASRRLWLHGVPFNSYGVRLQQCWLPCAKHRPQKVLRPSYMIKAGCNRHAGAARQDAQGAGGSHKMKLKALALQGPALLDTASQQAG